jgi:hypothetical protein
LALNLSPDGSAITFMGYIAPLNAIDVSNANTPMVYDPTDPAGGSYDRGVAQVGGEWGDSGDADQCLPRK